MLMHDLFAVDKLTIYLIAIAAINNVRDLPSIDDWSLIQEL